jgi:hypothetical protein
MNKAHKLLPAFSLENNLGEDASFPGSGQALICFVKEDCPTCKTVMPILEACHKAFGASIDVHLVGQNVDGNLQLIDEFALSAPLLDDSRLKVSFAYDVEIVPTLILSDPQGRELTRQEGFVREEWQNLLTGLSDVLELPAPEVDWKQFPEWRPGCGSLSVDPLIADRLQAEAENSPLRARKIEIAPGDDEFEFMFDQGFSDGLPLVPPSPERVLRMLSGTRRDSQEVVATVPPNMGEATIEKIAINAVMAGCKPEYLPIVVAALEGACTDEFNIHGVMATTMGASPVMVVNGPIRERVGMNMKLSALGQGNRANATIGRALRLAIRNIGGAKPGGTERPTLGNPMKFTMCFAEWEERSPWDPLHVERGFQKEDSTVTLICMTSGPTLIVDQTSLTAPQLAGSFGLALANVHHPKAYMGSDALLVICPEHIDTLLKDGHYSKEDVRNRILEVTKKPVKELIADEQSGVGIPAARFAAMPDEMKQGSLSKFRSGEDIHIVVAGSDAGKFSGAFHGWVNGPMGSIVVTRKIEE